MDDLVPMGKPGGAVQAVRDRVMDIFKCRDLGPISHFLGIKVDRNFELKSISLSQPVMIQSTLKKFHMEDAKHRRCDRPMCKAGLGQSQSE